MGVDVKQCFDEIEMLDKEEFHQKILRGVAATSEFSALVSIGVRFLTEEQKKAFAANWRMRGSRQNMNPIRSLMKTCRILADILPAVQYRLDKIMNNPNGE